MRTAEESSGTVLHRLIQEQLRYGNPTDTRSLLAIQQQALRGGGSGGGGGGGGAGSPGSPRSSLESLSQEEETPFVQMSARQEPQGQEHQGDYAHTEGGPVCHLYHPHGEELPTYEEAKAHSQYLASQQRGPGGPDLGVTPGGVVEGQWDLKREHARSLSERLMQLSLERNGNGVSSRERALALLPAMSSSHSDPQLSNLSYACPPAAYEGPGAFLLGPDHQRGPPPDYPCVRAPGYMLSHSQEHSHGLYYQEPPPPFHSQHHRFVPVEAQVVRHSLYPTVSSAGPEPFTTTTPSSPGGGSGASQMDLLVRENERLRRELEGYGEKAARLQKLELEIQRISEAYETLMKGSAKRETLEKTMRNKLEGEIKRLHDFNRDLRDRLDTATKQRVAREVESADQKQHVFTKLLEQNEEQLRERERLERELQRLRSSGEDWLRRRDALEQALGSAQGRNAQLEEELRRKRAYVEKVERLQSALAQLQAACEKREALELRLRTRLEHELKNLRAQQWQSQTPLSSELSSSSLQLREKEERILALEADITRWEQKYLEESTMRQFAMDAAATAAAQRDTTIIKHSPRHSPNNSFNDDLPMSDYRHQEMENRIRALHAQLLEKDAVIRVLQHRSRREQGRLEQQGLRLARSVPSINTAAAGPAPGAADLAVRGKGKSLSDDQTAAAPASASLAPAPPRPRSRDSSTQCDGAPEELSAPAAPQLTSAPLSDVSEQPKAPHNTYKNISSPDAEVVEILI